MRFDRLWRGSAIAGLIILAGVLAFAAPLMSAPAAAAASVTASPPLAATFEEKTRILVVTQIPLDAAPASASAASRKAKRTDDEPGAARDSSDANLLSGGMLPATFGEHGRIIMVGPGSKKHLLTDGFDSAADPEISFDGKRMLFAGKKAASDPWRIYEMDLTTREVHAITAAPSAESGTGVGGAHQGMIEGDDKGFPTTTQPASVPDAAATDKGGGMGFPATGQQATTATPAPNAAPPSAQSAAPGAPAPVAPPVPYPTDHRSPLYEGAFYVITAKEPWQIISFVGTAPDRVNEYGPVPTTALYSCRVDGSEIQRLTHNPSSTLTPVILPDGRLLYSQWQRGALDRGFAGRVSLFVSNIDGIDNAIFSGDEGKRVKLMPCVTPDRLVLFVEGDSVPWDGAGSLGSVSLRRNLHSYRPVTRPGDGLFVFPSPLPDGTILVSRRSEDGSGSHAVVRLDPRTGKSDPIFDDPKFHDIQARLVAPRPVPDGRSSVLTPDNPNGTLYGLDIFTSDLEGHGWIAPGEPWRLRLLEGIPRRREGVARLASEIWKGLGGVAGPGTTAEGIPPLIPRRFLGEVAIEEDGSFNVLVPANIPMQIQIVDSDGLAIRSCDWIWVRNRETRGCVGCHESGERAPENRFVKAITRLPMNLCLPPQRRRTVDFRRDLMPIIERRCAIPACHHPDGEAVPRFDAAPGKVAESDGRALFNRAYESLLEGNGSLISSHVGYAGLRSADAIPVAGRYVHPGGARTSPLVWHLFGRVTLRPWDAPVAGDAASGAAGSSVSAEEAGRIWPLMPPDGSPPLTDDERRTIIEWIDLGALWDGIPGNDSSNGENAGGSR